jgi:diguanylate cyclase (GGDEF)-like protein
VAAVPQNPFAVALARIAQPGRIVPMLLIGIAIVVIASGVSWAGLTVLGLIGIAGLFVYRDAGERRRDARELARLHDQLEDTARRAQQRAHDIAKLASLGQRLQACQGHAEAYDVIAQAMPALLRRPGALFVTDQSSAALQHRARWGESMLPAATLAPGECHAIVNGRLYEAGPGVAATCPHLMVLASQRTTCLPLTVHGDTRGLLVLTEAPHNGAGSGTDQEATDPGGIVTATAEQVALGLANLDLRETLRAQSIRDALTGLFNRRFLIDSLERECRRSIRAGRPVSVLMLDVDHFKNFNDTFGHEAGDAILREVGAVLRTSFRGEDAACRYGGEEFALVLTDTGTDGAINRAVELRQRVRKLSVNFRRQALGSISVSVGIAMAPVHAHDAAGLLRVADRALYRAKREGRDRVVVADARDLTEGAVAEAGLS